MKKLILCIGCCVCALTLWSQTKNTVSETIDYREKEGKIILSMLVNGEEADFVLDLAGELAVLPEYVEKLKIRIDSSQQQEGRFRYKAVQTNGKGSIDMISWGNNIFGNGVQVSILKDEAYLRELGVAGVVGPSLFIHSVLTIDAKRKKITTSHPYRPPYMKLNMRGEMELLPGQAICCPVTIDGKEFKVLLDTWNNGLFSLSAEDFARLSGSSSSEQVQYAYSRETPKTAQFNSSQLMFVKTILQALPIKENAGMRHSILGNEILQKGILSIDFGKRKIYFQSHDQETVVDEVITQKVEIVPGKLNEITRDYFLEHIYDYKTDKTFRFKGDKPVVIDFWATWCGPCMRMMPEMEKMAARYKDQIIFCKVNADKEKELCGRLNVSALPTLFFIPVNGQPIIEIGATPERYEQIIRELLLKE